jgi:hypothetical protein
LIHGFLDWGWDFVHPLPLILPDLQFLLLEIVAIAAGSGKDFALL